MSELNRASKTKRTFAMSPPKVLFEKIGVFIHTTIASVDEDALVPGKIQVVQKDEGIFVEWKPTEEEASGNGEADWHVVDTVSYNKAATGNGREAVKVNAKQPRKIPKKPERQKYVINFDVTDLKSFKRSKPNLGWSYLIFILKCGTTCPALHFHQGGTKAFIKELEKFLNVKKSPTDSCLFLVREQDPAALSKSFDELELFENQSRDIVSKFFHDPYSTTLGGFSKVTKFLQDVLLVPETDERPDSEVAAILQEDIEGININTNEEPGFEIVTTESKVIDLGKRPEVKRSEPLTPAQWSQHMDKDGCVKDVDKLKAAIFRGGVDASIRIEVWKFLLGYYSWESTYKSRTEQRKKKVDDYFRMKVQWKTVSEEQEKRFSLLRERKNLIDKDVTRTDRTHPFYQGEDNPNIQVLYDVLATYCMYNFDLGYVQGMSDLLAPILVVMENEVDAFWCFAGFMEQVAHHFEMTQEGMKNMLSDLHTLVKFVDPKLGNYLESHESGNMYFCFRWLLIYFKREFSFPDVMRLWEVMWTGKPCKNFHLVICLAILDTEKNVLIENNFGLTEILKHINDISGTIDLEDTLRKAEGMCLQVANCSRVPLAIAEMLGMESTEGATAAAASRSSTPGTPERTPNLALPSSSNSHTDAPLTSPEDNHSNIVDKMDMFQ